MSILTPWSLVLYTSSPIVCRNSSGPDMCAGAARRGRRLKVIHLAPAQPALPGQTCIARRGAAHLAGPKRAFAHHESLEHSFNAHHFNAHHEISDLIVSHVLFGRPMDIQNFEGS